MDSKAEVRTNNGGSGGGRQAPRSKVLIGLIGKGIQLSRTPAMHEAEGKRLGIDYTYRLFDVEKMGPNPPALGEIVRKAESEGFRGLNITHPYKQEILGHLDRLSENAEAVGSVNTVVLAEGKRSGHNTDLWGFREAFSRELGDAKRDHVVLLGAGGAGVAVAHALLDLGVGKLSISDPDGGRGRSLLARLQTPFGRKRAVLVEDVAGAAATADGLVNASPVGMEGRPGLPVSADLLRQSMWVADIIYFPIETALLRAARDKGCRTMNGEGMAVLQAVRAFEHFVGLPAHVETMRAAFVARGRSAA